MWAYAAVALAFGITPGPDVVLSIRHSMSRGAAHGVAVALGAASGSLVWGVAAAVGLASVVQHAPTAYQVIKLAGGAYLIYLGVQSITRARSAHRYSETGRVHAPQGHLAAFRVGLIADLLNPKMGAFCLALLPQFVPQGGDFFRWSMLFMTIELVIAITCLSGYAVLAQAAGRLLKRPSVMAWLERGLGGILIGLGLRVAL